jgi:hypothetical protein
MNRITNYTYEEAANLLKYFPEKPMKVVDLGAGKRDSPISEQMKRLDCDWLISLEAFEPYLEFLLHGGHKARLHDVIKHKIETYRFPRDTDVVVMVDVIEHLEEEEALDLIERAQNTPSVRTIIIFTPEGDTIGYSNHDMGNELQEHKSAWFGYEFEDLGFDVTIYENFHTHVKDRPIGAIWAVWNREKSG